jgi:hypothetical protein
LATIAAPGTSGSAFRSDAPCRITRPRRTRSFALGHGRLAAVTFDADEAQYVSVYRVIG